MGLSKGHTNNPHGRKKGTPNKATAELRETLQNILSNEIEKIPETLQALDPKEKLDAITKLLPYIVPKMQSIEYKDESEPQQGGVIRFVKGPEDERIDLTYIIKHLDLSDVAYKDFDLSNLSYEELLEIKNFTKKMDLNN